MAKGRPGGLDDEILSDSAIQVIWSLRWKSLPHLQRMCLTVSPFPKLLADPVRLYHEFSCCWTLEVWVAVSPESFQHICASIHNCSKLQQTAADTPSCPLNIIKPDKPRRRLPTRPQQTKKCWGLATLMCDCLAVELQSINFDYTSQSVHPFYGSYRCAISVECQGCCLFSFKSGAHSYCATFGWNLKVTVPYYANSFQEH